MLEISSKTNLLEQSTYKYSLQDVKEPNLYREVYPYTDVPRIPFNHRRVPIGMPQDIWITDTSFRDGQQSVEPYSVKNIVDLFKLMSRLSGPFGIIRQTEFFVYSQKDREALQKCQCFTSGKFLLFYWENVSVGAGQQKRPLPARGTALISALTALVLDYSPVPNLSSSCLFLLKIPSIMRARAPSPVTLQAVPKLS